MQKTQYFLILTIIVTIFSACSTAERNIRRAEQSLSRGEYEAAATYLKKAYQLTSPKERQKRGLIAYRNGGVLSKVWECGTCYWWI